MDEINSGLYEMYKKNPLSVSTDVQRLLLEARIETARKIKDQVDERPVQIWITSLIVHYESQLKELGEGK